MTPSGMKVKRVLEKSRKKTDSGREIEVNSYVWKKYEETAARPKRMTNPTPQANQFSNFQGVRQYGQVQTHLQPTPQRATNYGHRATGVVAPSPQINRNATPVQKKQLTPIPSNLAKVGDSHNITPDSEEINGHQIEQRGHYAPTHHNQISKFQTSESNKSAIRISGRAQTGTVINGQPQSTLIASQSARPPLQPIQRTPSQYIPQKANYTPTTPKYQPNNAQFNSSTQQNNRIQYRQSAQKSPQPNPSQLRQISRSPPPQTANPKPNRPSQGYSHISDPNNPFYAQFLKLQKMSNNLNTTPKKPLQTNGTPIQSHQKRPEYKENIPMNTLNGPQPTFTYSGTKNLIASQSQPQTIRLEGTYNKSPNQHSQNRAQHSGLRGYKTQVNLGISGKKEPNHTGVRQALFRPQAIQRPNQDRINQIHEQKEYVQTAQNPLYSQQQRKGQVSGRVVMPPPNTNQNMAEYMMPNASSNFIQDFSGHNFDCKPSNSGQMYRPVH